MSAELFSWLVDPERCVLADYDREKDQIAVSWNTSRGRIETCAETLDLAIKKAHAIDQNTDPEQRIRLAYTPTAHHKAWSTACRPDGRWGWHGFITVNADMPDDLEFELPKLPYGWVYEEFFSDIRRHKNKRVAYLKKKGKLKSSFSFQVKAPRSKWDKTTTEMLDALRVAIGEVERANFIIDPVWS